MGDIPLHPLHFNALRTVLELQEQCPGMFDVVEPFGSMKWERRVEVALDLLLMRCEGV